MKKLVFAMGCFAAILLNSSCTADSPVETQNENLTTPNKIKAPETGSTMATEDDKNPPRPIAPTDDINEPSLPGTDVSSDGIDDKDPPIL